MITGMARGAPRSAFGSSLISSLSRHHRRRGPEDLATWVDPARARVVEPGRERGPAEAARPVSHRDGDAVARPTPGPAGNSL